MKNVFAKNGIGFILAGLMLVTTLFSSGCVRRYGYGPGYYGPRYHDNDRDRDRRHDRDGYRYR